MMRHSAAKIGIPSIVLAIVLFCGCRAAINEPPMETTTNALTQQTAIHEPSATNSSGTIFAPETPVQTAKDKLLIAQLLKKRLTEYMDDTYGNDLPETYGGCYIEFDLLFINITQDTEKAEFDAFISAELPVVLGRPLSAEDLQENTWVHFNTVPHSLMRLKAVATVVDTYNRDYADEEIQVSIEVSRNIVIVALPQYAGDALRDDMEAFLQQAGVSTDEVQIAYWALA